MSPLAVAVGIIMIVIGALHLAFPYAVWFLSVGWKIRDAEPSDAYLTITRIGGGVGAGIGVIVLFVGIMQLATGSHRTSDSMTTFFREMTTQNIQSIEAHPAALRATPAQIRVFAHDVHHISVFASLTGGGSYSTAQWFTIRCRDGYVVTLSNMNQSGLFGVVPGATEISPMYEFTSTNLNQWAQTF